MDRIRTHGLEKCGMSAKLEARSVTRIYGEKDNPTIGCQRVNFILRQGELVSLMGPSGSGKSTLLKILGGIDAPTEGQVFYGNDEITGMDAEKLANLRRDRIGFVFQDFKLIPHFNIIDNVGLSSLLASRPRKKWSKLALEHLMRFGLESVAERYPRQLSGGQQQRVAIARAFFRNPDVLLADEPTGNLDRKNSELVMQTIRHEIDANRGAGSGLLVTHDERAAAYADRVLFLVDGQIRNEWHLPKFEDRKINDKRMRERVDMLRAWLAAAES